MTFESPRLIARRFGPHDVEAFTALRNDPQVARYQAWETYSMKQARTFIAVLASRNPGDPGWYQFALEDKERGGFIGDCGLRIMESENRLAQVGYTIVRAHWNRGFATEIVAALTDYAFASFPIHRITASVDPRNAASCRVLEKTGYVQEAHFRQSEWFKGAWADDVIYARLRSEHTG